MEFQPTTEKAKEERDERERKENAMPSTDSDFVCEYHKLQRIKEETEQTAVHDKWELYWVWTFHLFIEAQIAAISGTPISIPLPPSTSKKLLEI